MSLAILTSAPSVCRNMVRARDFEDAGAMRAHYAEVHARLWTPRLPPAPASEPEPAPTTSEPMVRELEPEASDDLREDPAQIDPRAETPRDIIHRVARAHGLTSEDLRGQSRAHRIVRARRAAIAAILEARPRASLAQIGRWMEKDHTTVLHALRAMGLSTEGSADRTRLGGNEGEAAEPKVAVPTPRSVVADIARRHGFRMRDVLGRGRCPVLESVRQEALVAVADAFPAMGAAAVAAVFGRERSTLSHARKRLARRRAASPTPPAQETQP